MSSFKGVSNIYVINKPGGLSCKISQSLDIADYILVYSSVPVFLV